MSAGLIDKSYAAAEVERAAENLDNAQRQRDRAILNARDTGLSIRTIAELAGVSPQTVLNICKRNENQ